MRPGELNQEKLERLIRQRAIQLGTERGQLAYEKRGLTDPVEVKRIGDQERVNGARAAELKTIGGLSGIMKIEAIDRLLLSAYNDAIAHAIEKSNLLEQQSTVSSEEMLDSTGQPAPKPQDWPSPR